eukprot:9500251-Pyramimonas_sp.AAC.1
MKPCCYTYRPGIPTASSVPQESLQGPRIPRNPQRVFAQPQESSGNARSPGIPQESSDPKEFVGIPTECSGILK